MQPLTAYRSTGIDLLRGIVMIIMALDHTREFFHSAALTGDPLDAATTTPILFFTRWITHYCAPVFVFLSGVSAFISASRKTKKEASAILIRRGFWLVLVEITLVSLGIGFNPLMNFIFLQVIWVIGWSMVLLGLSMRISDRFVLVAGAILFFGHNILDFFSISRDGVSGAFWNLFFLAKGSAIPYATNRAVIVLYALLPWTGVMFMGYSIGRWFSAVYPAEKRIRNLRFAGIFLLLMYVILRLTGWYGDPVAWENGAHPVMSFLNVEKYPPSLQFLGMTLGPALIALSFLDKLQPGQGKFIQVYGRVPFFYYLLHFYLLHVLCVIAFFVAGYPADKITETFILFRPLNFGYSLAIVYLIWAAVVLVLYKPCLWFYRYKKSHQHWWLAYV